MMYFTKLIYRRLIIFIKIIFYLAIHGFFDRNIRESILLSFRKYLSKNSRIEVIDPNDIINWDLVKIKLSELSLSYGNVSRFESLIIASLCSQLDKNSNVIEIGTFDGKTTINCAINLINSKIYTLDLPEDEDTSELKRVNEYLEYDKELIISNKRKNKKFENMDNINQIYCDSTSFDFSQIDFSLAFIDGGHDYNTVKSDTINCIENIQKPGIILWHDYDVTNPVGLYLRSISKKYKIYWIKDTRICISWIK